MSGVEFGLAILGAVDLCFKYGKELIAVCDRFRHAEAEIAERTTRIQAIWFRTKSQLELVRRIAPILAEEHRNVQEETLKVFANKLDVACTKLLSFVKTVDNSVSSRTEWQLKSTKYALFGKNLDKAIDELEVWQSTFDQSWFLIMKAAQPQIDMELEALRIQPARSSIKQAQSVRAALDQAERVQAPIFLPAEGLDSIQTSPILYCSAELGQREGTQSSVILEHIARDYRFNYRVLKLNARNLARKLSHADPLTFGLLNCKGVVEHTLAKEPHAAFTLVLRIPREFSQPQSLRSLLLEGQASHSLSDRFKLAAQLAQSIGYIHTFGFVHKNVLPETILLFQTNGSSIGQVTLVGFGNFRDAEGGTLRVGDSAWEKNIYRHPRRQGHEPQDDYIMQHDIYTLGVCLLEIGLWESFVVYNENNTKPSPSPSTILGFSTDDPQSHDAARMKDHLVSLACEVLPRRMGTRYADIVETCLTCLDDGNFDFGSEQELSDADGILIGARYIEKVIMRLNSIYV